MPLSVAEFWEQCRAALPHLPREIPEAWAFGATHQQANELLNLVLVGKKTATASALWGYESAGEPLPTVGELNIIMDADHTPRVLTETVEVVITPFNEVSADHAYYEGEGDRSLAYWRAVHEEFWRQHSANTRGFDDEMPVVCERFRVVYRRDEGARRVLAGDT